MQKTYENLRQLYQAGLTDKACIEGYKKDQNPVFLSTVFVRHFPMLLNVSRQFWGVSSEDMASFCLEETHQALLLFSSDRGTKFSTFLFSCVHNRLRAETQAINTQKRRANYQADDFSASFSEKASSDSFEVSDTLMSLRNSALSPRELSYCEFVLENGRTVSDTDFAEKQGISCQVVYYMKQQLRGKISALFGTVAL